MQILWLHCWRVSIENRRGTFFQLHKLGVAVTAVVCLLGWSWLIWGIVFVSQDITYVRISRTGLPVPNWLLGVGLIIVLLMSIKETVSGWSYYVDFEDGMIKTKGHRFMPPQSRFQFKLQIKTKDITAIRVIKSHYNSNKKPSSVLARTAPITYFEFTLANGRTKWLDIYLFSKKQRIRMLDIINEELGTDYDCEAMYKKGESIEGGCARWLCPRKKKKTKTRREEPGGEFDHSSEKSGSGEENDSDRMRNNESDD